jgi:hypothetical protein
MVEVVALALALETYFGGFSSRPKWTNGGSGVIIEATAQRGGWASKRSTKYCAVQYSTTLSEVGAIRALQRRHGISDDTHPECNHIA